MAQRSVTPTAGHTSHLRACPPARPLARALALKVVFSGVARWCVRQHAKWVCDGDPRSDAAQRADRTSALQPSGVRRRNSPQIAYTSDGPAGVLEASRSRCGRCVHSDLVCEKRSGSVYSGAEGYAVAQSKRAGMAVGHSRCCGGLRRTPASAIESARENATPSRKRDPPGVLRRANLPLVCPITTWQRWGRADGVAGPREGGGAGHKHMLFGRGDVWCSRASRHRGGRGSHHLRFHLWCGLTVVVRL